MTHVLRDSTHTRPRAAGFTLIELLVVIGILSVLAVVLLPNVIGASEAGKIGDTTARLEFLAQGAKTYERRVAGHYPPDNFADPKGKVTVKNNGVNPGIESLIVFLCQQRLGSDSVADHEDWLDNTDGDENTRPIPVLDRLALMEVVDAWGMPIVYFSAKFGGYDTAQRIRTPEGDTIKVNAVINPRNGKPAGKGKFQLISAGPDGEFGTLDDITIPAIVRE